MPTPQAAEGLGEAQPLLAHLGWAPTRLFPCGLVLSLPTEEQERGGRSFQISPIGRPAFSFPGESPSMPTPGLLSHRGAKTETPSPNATTLLRHGPYDFPDSSRQVAPLSN